MKIVHPLLSCSLLLSTSAYALASTWTPDPSLPNPEQHVKLYEIGRKYAEANFDADANLVGTNTKHPPNRRQHATRESAYYAYGLLLTGDPVDAARAQPILRRVCATQDLNMKAPTGGAFGWIAEDLPTDLNSAAFVGAALADVIELDRHRPCLEPATREMVETAGKLAVQAVMKRDVDASYTNIAILSSALAAAGEKLWAVPGAGKWAEGKIDAITQLTGDGEFSEYLAPTYSAVDIAGLYLARRFSFSDAFGAKIDALTDHFWKQTALAYHAPTYQLCGPCARSYGDNMLTYVAGLKYDLYLALNGAYPLPDNETDHTWDKGGLMEVANLPIPVRPEFQQPVPAWREWTAAMPNNAPPRRLSQFRDGNFILGTIAIQDEWKQKRNLVSYWRNDDATAVEGLRVGYCIDQTNESIPGGFPPQKMHFYCKQVNGTALVALMTPLKPPEGGAAVRLVFAPTAKLTSAPDSVPLRVEDGSITTWIYPVTDGKATFAGTADDRSFQLNRTWTTADELGPMHVAAYLVVFRPAGQPAPAVSDLKLESNGDSGNAVAKVDGQELRVSFNKTD